MILAICCWIFTFTFCQGKYVEVNNEVNDSIDCCIIGTHLCGSLYKALSCIEDNSVINITSSLVTLHNAAHMRSRNNITIVGNEVTVTCNDTGSLDCLYCSNVVIQGITWDRCGNPNDSVIPYAIAFVTAVNVTITKCTFQYAKVCTVVVVYSLPSGFLKVHDSRFLFNHVTNPLQCAARDNYASLAIIDYTGLQNVHVSIRRTLFYHNGPYLDVVESDSYITNNPSLLCLFSSFSSPRAVKLDIENVTISTTFGLGGNFFFFPTFRVTVQFTNVNFLNNSNGGSVIRIVTNNSQTDVLQILSCNYTNNVNGALKVLISSQSTSEVTFHKLTIMGNKGTFGKDMAVSSDAIDQGVGIFTIIKNANISNIYMSYCNIYDNIGSQKSSIVYIMVSLVRTTKMTSITSSNFTSNVGSALYLSSCTAEFEGDILFMNNSAARGGAMYLDQGSQIAIKENSINFIGNNAEQQGGAIFIDLLVGSALNGLFSCPHDGITVTSLSSTANVSFTDNAAGIVGNSIYFNIPEACSIIKEVLIYKFNYSHIPEIIGPAIATSPHKVNVCSIASNDTGETCHIPNGNMLGQSIGINATVYDYFDHVSETVQFYVECTNCNNKYRLSNDKILVHRGLFHITFKAVDADSDIIDDVNVTLKLSSVLPNENRQLTAATSLKLSSCKSGYVFDINLQQCVCYDQSEDVIQCQQEYAEIKYGYWFGIAVFPRRTVSLCPIEYCGFTTETSNGYYKLPEMLSDQCSPHRTGVACGKCKPGYTLAYDSPDCIHKDKCSAGMTVLVIVLTILYWIIVVVLVFALMQRKLSLGYAYGLIYYYSIIDILLGSDLFISDGVFQLVTILSSFAKLTPQFLGKLCFVQGLSGIDQQFIHYFHAISIFLLIVIIVIAARYSFRIASFVSHSIIRVICLLILLSYTSFASASLQLLRPLYFHDVNGAYVYSSPSIKYFTGRHILYGIIALLCELFIVIGLPLLLLLEPFLKRKINFIKIKPLLDQFQECYKDQYHWFAAYYLVCRQVIIIIVYVSKSLYYLQTVSIIIVAIHVCIKPYKSETLNVLDGIILLTMILVINLNSFVFSRPSTITIVVLTVIFPLILSCLICLKVFVFSMKYSWIFKKTNDDQEVSPKSAKYVYVIK